MGSLSQSIWQAHGRADPEKDRLGTYFDYSDLWTTWPAWPARLLGCNCGKHPRRILEENLTSGQESSSGLGTILGE